MRKTAIDKRVLFVRTFGNFLVLISLIGILFTFWPVISVFTLHTLDNLRGKTFEVASSTVKNDDFGDMLASPDPDTNVLVPKDPNFSLIIEKIGANAPVIANVDASSKPVYMEALRKGVAHALGTALPGQPGVSYMFAHSTDTIWNVPRYNAVFFLLKDMEPGDKIVIFFQNKRYDYVVTEKKITEATDVSYFTMQTEEQILVLQTCYPPGTTWKRLLVIAKPEIR